MLKKNKNLIKKITIKYIKEYPQVLGYDEDNIVSIISARLPDSLLSIPWEDVKEIILNSIDEYRTKKVGTKRAHKTLSK